MTPINDSANGSTESGDDESKQDYTAHVGRQTSIERGSNRFRHKMALLLLFVLSSWFGMTYVATYGQNGVYFQQYYGPAVMIASGYGFVNPVASASPLLQDFLDQKTRSLDVRELPDSIPTSPVTQLQARWLYMLYIVGTIWRIFGVSWDALLPLFGLFCGSVTLALYAIFSLASNRTLAILAAVFLTLSPFNLVYLPDLRDYSKAPFILGTIACLGSLVKYEFPVRRQFLWVCLLGALLGIGLGFRKDVIICIPPIFLVCSVLLPGSPFRQWRQRTALILAFLTCFIVTAWPLLSAMREKGGTTAHVLILGLMEPFDTSLGIGGVPYSFGQEYLDAYVFSQVQGYWQRHGDGTEIPYATSAYDRACREVHRHFLWNFPADMVTRWQAATERILDYGPFLTENWVETSQNPLVDRLFRWRWSWFKWLSGWGLPIALCTCILLALLRLRFGLAYLLIAAYFTGYSSLQFQHRHHFHLEFFFWWPVVLAMGLACDQRIWLGIKQVLGNKQFATRALVAHFWPAGAIKLTIMTAILFVIGIVPGTIARSIQNPKVEQMYERYRGLALEPLQAEILELGSVTGLRPAGFTGTPSPGEDATDKLREDYLVLEFDASEPIVFWIEYDQSMNNYTSRVEIPASSGDEKTVRYFLPVFQAPSSEWYMASFLHLAIPSRFIPSYKGMYRVKDLQEVDVLTPLLLYADSEMMSTAYQRISYKKPLFPRALYAMQNNLLANGGMEEWTDAHRPVGFDPPELPTVLERSTEFAASGTSSIKLVWASDPGPTSILARFRTRPVRLKPSSTYELFMDCYNRSNLKLLVGVWEISRSPNGTLETFRLSPAVLEYRHGSSFSKASGEFTTTANVSAEVVITVSPSGENYPAEAYLDNLALTEVKWN